MEGVFDSPADIVAAARAGDSAAFELLVRDELPGALAAATAITGSSSIGKDAVQEALLSAWRALPALRVAEAFPAWFRRQVVRAAWKTARSRRRIQGASSAVPMEVGAVDTRFAGVDDRLALEHAFADLSVDERTVLALRYVWGLDQEATARALGIPVGTVKSRVHTATVRFRHAYTRGSIHG